MSCMGFRLAACRLCQKFWATLSASGRMSRCRTRVMMVRSAAGMSSAASAVLPTPLPPVRIVTVPHTGAPTSLPTPRLTHALALIEHAGGQNVRQARLTIRQLLAERDRVLREQVAMRRRVGPGNLTPSRSQIRT